MTLKELHGCDNSAIKFVGTSGIKHSSHTRADFPEWDPLLREVRISAHLKCLLKAMIKTTLSLCAFHGGPRGQLQDLRGVTAAFWAEVHSADNGSVLHATAKLEGVMGSVCVAGYTHAIFSGIVI